MKNLIVPVLSVILCAQAAFASCDAETKALSAIDALEKYGVAENIMNFLAEEIAATKEHIAKDEFCPGSRGNLGEMGAYLNRVSLCTSLAVSAALVPGAESRIKAADPANQRALDQALLDYGKLFRSSDETQGFACDLKTLKFSGLGE